MSRQSVEMFLDDLARLNSDAIFPEDSDTELAVRSMVADNSDVNDNFIIHFNVPIWGGEDAD